MWARPSATTFRSTSADVVLHATGRRTLTGSAARNVCPVNIVNTVANIRSLLYDEALGGAEVSTAALSAIRRDNTLAIIGALSTSGQLTRAQLVRATTLSRTTMHRILGELLSTEVLIERFNEPDGPGRPTGLLGINTTTAAVMGIEIGRAQVAATVLNWAGEALWSQSRSIASARDVDATLHIIDEILMAATETGELSPLRHVVVGMHGLMPSSRDHTDNKERDSRIQLVSKHLTDRLSVPVMVTGNTRLAGLAEYRSRGLTAQDFVYCHLSRGVGTAIILGGTLRAGFSNSAGEFGHTRVVNDGPECHCGSRGCLETLIGIDSVLQRARALRPELRDLEHFRRMSSDYPELRTLAVDIAHSLGRALGNMVNILNPEYVVLGGELAELTDDWLTLVTEGLHETALPQVSNGLRLSPSHHRTLGSAHGAGLLALDHILGRASLTEGERAP